MQVPEGAMVESQGLLVSYWISAWSLETVQKFHTLFTEVKARQPKGVAILMSFRTDAIDARVFGHEPTRKELMRLGATFDGFFRQSSIVIHGTGFVAAALRSSTWALTAVGVKRVPKYFDDVQDAARFIAMSSADLGVSKETVVRADELARTAALEFVVA
ncbi:MAG: hypothetical protein JNK05_07690 [Myxococcales bacterium]|nr:hypothetical protein [Myxococcales bacterium]